MLSKDPAAAANIVLQMRVCNTKSICSSWPVEKFCITFYKCCTEKEKWVKIIGRWTDTLRKPLALVGIVKEENPLPLSRGLSRWN